MRLYLGAVDLNQYEFPEDMRVGSNPDTQAIAYLDPYYIISEYNVAYMIQQVTGIEPYTSITGRYLAGGSIPLKVTWESLNQRYQELNSSVQLTRENVTLCMLLPEVLESNYQYLIAHSILTYNVFENHKSLTTNIKGTVHAVEAYVAVVEHARKTFDATLTMGTALSYSPLDQVKPLINVQEPQHFDDGLVTRYLRYLVKRNFVWRKIPYSHPLKDLPVLVFDGVLKSVTPFYHGQDAHLKAALSNPRTWSKYINLSLNLQGN